MHATAVQNDRIPVEQQPLLGRIFHGADAVRDRQHIAISLQRRCVEIWVVMRPQSRLLDVYGLLYGLA